MLATRPSSSQEAASATSSSQQEKNIPGVRPMREIIDESVWPQDSGCGVKFTPAFFVFANRAGRRTASQTSSRKVTPPHLNWMPHLSRMGRIEERHGNRKQEKGVP